MKRELEARGGSAAAIAGPGSPSRLGESDRPSYPRPELPGGLSAGGPPPLNGESGESPESYRAYLASGRSPYPPPAGSGPVATDRRDRPHPTSPPPLLSDLDPENVSRELKKEGSDWFAVWSSQSKKQLDVSLVHTLSHET